MHIRGDILYAYLFVKSDSKHQLNYQICRHHDSHDDFVRQNDIIERVVPLDHMNDGVPDAHETKQRHGREHVMILGKRRK